MQVSEGTEGPAALTVAALSGTKEQISLSCSSTFCITKDIPKGTAECFQRLHKLRSQKVLVALS